MTNATLEIDFFVIQVSLVPTTLRASTSERERAQSEGPRIFS